MRGDLKTKVKPLAGSMFGFEVPVDEAGRAKNRQLAASLKEGCSYLYKVCLLSTGDFYSYLASFQTQATATNAASGLFEAKIIQTAVNACFFKNRIDIGVEFTDIFQPFPHVALSVVLAAVSLSFYHCSFTYPLLTIRSNALLTSGAQEAGSTSTLPLKPTKVFTSGISNSSTSLRSTLNQWVHLRCFPASCNAFMITGGELSLKFRFFLAKSICIESMPVPRHSSVAPLMVWPLAHSPLLLLNINSATLSSIPLLPHPLSLFPLPLPLLLPLVLKFKCRI